MFTGPGFNPTAGRRSDQFDRKRKSEAIPSFVIRHSSFLVRYSSFKLLDISLTVGDTILDSTISVQAYPK